MPETSPSPMCLRCERACPRPVRGVCGTCYQRCRREVLTGAASWESLEAEGKILRANLDNRRRKAWMSAFYKSKFAGKPHSEADANGGAEARGEGD